MAGISVTTRLRLREFSLGDVHAVYALSREVSLARFIPDQVYADEAEAREVLAMLMTCYGKLLFPYVLAAELIETGELIGHVGLSEIPEGIEIGFAIGEEYQGRGYATEAVSGMIRWAVERLGLEVIYGIAMDENIASLRVLEKAGFARRAEQKRAGWVMTVWSKNATSS